jgi:hypothetical protein
MGRYIQYKQWDVTLLAHVDWETFLNILISRYTKAAGVSFYIGHKIHLNLLEIRCLEEIKVYSMKTKRSEVQFHYNDSSSAPFPEEML